ncbi:hypothetical protein GGX14DRAFT_417237, partial [Mycena pura]
MPESRSRSPSPKRVKLEPLPPPTEDTDVDEPQRDLSVEDEDRCSICLQEIVDRTVIPLCAHEFCFDCLIVWTDQSRRCPLCSQTIGDFLMHKIRSRYDYQKHYLAPLTTSPVPLQRLPLRQIRAIRHRPRERAWGRRASENDEADRLERSVAKRRWIYQHNLYAKHVASNSYTRYRPFPTPAQFAASPDLISRTTMFLRRELQVWVNLDVEFLTNFTISIMKAIDIRSESAVKLLAEFLDLDAPYVEGWRHVNAEHFAHEVYSYVRSPYKDLFVYDTVVQYDVPAGVPELAEEPRRRWRASASPEASARDNRSRHSGRARSRSRSQYSSRSRSGGRYTLSRDLDSQPNERTSRGSGTRRSELRTATRNRSRGRGYELEHDTDAGRETPARYLPQSRRRFGSSAGATGATEPPDIKGKSRDIIGRTLPRDEDALPAVSTKRLSGIIGAVEEDSAAPVYTEQSHNDGTRRGRARSRSRSKFSSHSSRCHSKDRAYNDRPSRRSSGRQQRNANLGREQEEEGLEHVTNAAAAAARVQQKLPEPLCPDHGAAVEVVEPKGKSSHSTDVAAPAVLSTGQLRSHEEAILGISAATDVTGAAELPPRKPPPRIRNRSLLESVQAHLTLPAWKQPKTRTQQDSDPRSSKPSSASAISPPSLLTRLSEPEIRQGSLPLSPVEGEDATVKPWSSPSAPGGAIPIGKESLSGSHIKRAPAPEIVALTPARHARLTADMDPRYSHSMESLSIDSGVRAVQAPTPLAGSLGGGDGNSGISTSTGESPTLRTTLLRRLEEERQKACEAVVIGKMKGDIVGPREDVIVADDSRVALDSFSQIATPDADVTRCGDTGSGTLAGDARAAEARLRRQAQLRVRLAAEKRESARKASF